MTSSGEAKHVRLTTQEKGGHTPGPWEWWTSCSWKRLTSKTADGKWMREGNVLCPSIASDGHPVLDVSEADMALIAAAPEMLEALKAELADLQDDIRWADGGELERLMMRRDRLMAVLSKAEALI